MSFLASAAQKGLLILQRNQVDFERHLITNKAMQISREMNYYANEQGENVELDDDPYYIELEQTQEFLEARQDSLTTQYEVLDKEISSLQTAVNNNIKSGCTLNLIGG